MKAVILLAGKGKRIRDSITEPHKSLIQIGNHAALWYLIKNVLKSGIEDIIAVTGFHGDAVQDYIHTSFPDVSVKFLENTQFETTNNLASVLCAKPFIGKDDFVVINGDMIFDYHILERITEKQESFIAIDVLHRENPIDGLTTEQIQKIYTGELINWRELGGSARPIRAFQSEENSQTVLEQIMNDLPLMEAETEIRSTGVGWGTPRIAAYRNYENALGFSFRFHTAELVKNDEIKLLAFDGVEPTQETIRSGSYPLSAYFYAVTASSAGQPAPETENRDLAAFLSWILSPQGQEIIEKAGYVPLT